MSHHFHDRPACNERFSGAFNQHHDAGLHIHVELNLLSLQGEGCHRREPLLRHCYPQAELRFVPPVVIEYQKPNYQAMPLPVIPVRYFSELEPLTTCPAPYLPAPRPYFPGPEYPSHQTYLPYPNDRANDRANQDTYSFEPTPGFLDGGSPEARSSLNENPSTETQEAQDNKASALTEASPEAPATLEPAPASLEPAANAKTKEKDGEKQEEKEEETADKSSNKESSLALPASETAGAASPLRPAEPPVESSQDVVPPPTVKDTTEPSAPTSQPAENTPPGLTIKATQELLLDPEVEKKTAPATAPEALAQAKADANTEVKNPVPPPTVPDALKPMVIVQSHMLHPLILNPKADPMDQQNRAYNPMAPIGLTEGYPGSDLDEGKAGVLERKVKWSGAKNECDTIGKLDDDGASIMRLHIRKPDGSGLDWNWGDTKFATHDSFSDQKLASRVTTYDRGISMNFQTEKPGQPLHIDGVRKIVSIFDSTQASYSTVITNENNQKWNFTSDQNGVVMGVQGPF